MRFQSARDLAFSLEVLADSDTIATPSAAAATTRGRRRMVLAAAIALALVASVASWFTWRASPRPAPSDPLAGATFTRLTDWPGTEEGAEISPDGKFVAFLSDRDGEYDLWLSQIGTGRFTNLSRDLPALAGSGFIVRKLGFSGDGSALWFNPADGKPLKLVDLIGGTPRPFLGEGANVPAWSPDGTRLVYVYKPNRDDPMYLADRTGANARQILPPGTLKNNNPVWSSDGQWIYFVRGSEPQDEMNMDIWRLRPSPGGGPERLTQQHAAPNFLAPLDSQTVLYTSRAEDWSGPWLWALDVDRKTTRRVVPGVDQYTSVSSSRDGRRIVVTVANPTAGLWKVPLGDGPADEQQVEPFPLSVPTGSAWAPRFVGTSIFYLSARGTGDGLWRIQDGQASEVRRGADAMVSEPAAVSPDGQRVVLVVRTGGKRGLSIMSSDGTNAQPLAPNLEIAGASGQGIADWSPDGKWIVAGGRDAQGPGLFKIPAEGTDPPVRLITGQAVNPVWSPKGDLIVYSGRSIVGQVEVLGVRPDDGARVELPTLLTRPGGYRFLPDGSGLVYLPRIQGLDFWLLEFGSKTSRQITSLGSHGALRTFDITPDGKSIVFDRSQQNSDIVLIDLPKP
jgi:Tol biopolymer transport system component